MNLHFSKSTLLVLFLFLVFLSAVLWAAMPKKVEGVLTVSFLDVGQGDAIYIQSPTGIEVLIDGGKDTSVLRELSRKMRLFDRTLDVVIATHPDADHIGGLPDVLRRFAVSHIVRTSNESDTSFEKRFEEYVAKEKNSHETVIATTTRIDIGGGAYLDVLYPFTSMVGRESNESSIVAKLVYGETSFLLTGDAPCEVEYQLIQRYGTYLDSDVLKAGHHGSRTSSCAEFLGVVSPDTFVISAGRDNSYGHPHEEVLERARAAGTRILSTQTEKTISFTSDGSVIFDK